MMDKLLDSVVKNQKISKLNKLEILLANNFFNVHPINPHIQSQLQLPSVGSQEMQARRLYMCFAT